MQALSRLCMQLVPSGFPLVKHAACVWVCKDAPTHSAVLSLSHHSPHLPSSVPTQPVTACTTVHALSTNQTCHKNGLANISGTVCHTFHTACQSQLALDFLHAVASCRCALCVFPAVADIVSVAFSTFFLLALLATTRRMIAAAINRRIQRRLRIFQAITASSEFLHTAPALLAVWPGHRTVAWRLK